MDSPELLLNPHKQLLFAISSTRQILGSVSEEVETLDAFVNDFGEKMNPDIRDGWKSKLTDVLHNCEVNSAGLTEEMQKLCLVTLYAIEGRFCEVVEKDYQRAGSCYERAAAVLASMPKTQLEKLVGHIAKGYSVSQEEKASSGKAKMTPLESIGVGLAIVYRLLEVGLWNSAGDNYCRAGTTALASPCYDRGINVSSGELAGEVFGPWEIALRWVNCRLALSMATAVLIPSDKWQEAELLYGKAADSMFFNIDQKGNSTYGDISSILAYGLRVGARPYGFVEPSWFPRAPVSAKVQEDDRLLRLKSELGQRALDTLRKDYEKSEKGFPVPETYFLVMTLSNIYTELQEYEKCMNLVTPGEHDFDDAFYEWTYEELTKEHDWAFCFIEHSENVSFVRGLLQRPDYKEFVEGLKKAEESHQRLEWRQIRFEKVLEGAEDKTGFEKVRTQLTAENPWLEGTANPGSVLNAEVIYQNLKKTNWGEVIVGLCNAVEEELKAFVYKEYLAFVAGLPDKNYVQESQRQKSPQSVLYYIASATTNQLAKGLWNSFVKARIPEAYDFLCNQLPSSLSSLVELRNPSAHGKMPNEAKAEKAREIVLGKGEQSGILAKLVALHKPAV